MTALPQTKTFVSVEDYLEREKTAEYRSEYYQGEVFAMSGGSPEHSLLSMNTGAELRNVLRGGACRVYGPDLRIHVPATGLYTYPDASVVCGPSEVTDDGYSLKNPVLLVEVLSPSTESYDRGQKFTFYRSIPSLREYVLVAQDRKQVEVYRKGSDGHWTLYEPEDGVIELASVDVTLDLDDLYAGVELPEKPPLR